MVRFKSVEEIEHSAHSVPNVTAHADMPNGALVGLTYTGSSKVTKAPATGNDLYVVINTQVGDKEYETEKTIATGARNFMLMRQMLLEHIQVFL